jgi:hypothetical protein
METAQGSLIFGVRAHYRAIGSPAMDTPFSIEIKTYSPGVGSLFYLLYIQLRDVYLHIRAPTICFFFCCISFVVEPKYSSL